MKKIIFSIIALILCALFASCRTPVDDTYTYSEIKEGERSSELKATGYKKDKALSKIKNSALGNGFSCMAKSEDGILYVDIDTGEIAFEDPSGKLWRSSVTEEQMDFDLLTPNQKKIATSPLVLEYTFLNNRNGVATKSAFLDLDHEVSVKAIENGALIVFYAKDIAIRIYVEVTLEDGGLKITIPKDGIEEGVGVQEQIDAARTKIDGYVTWVNNVISVMEEDTAVSKHSSGIAKLKNTFRVFTEEIYQIKDAVDIKTAIDEITELLEDVKTVYKGGVGTTGLFTAIQQDGNVNDDDKATYKAVYNKFDSTITQIKLLTQQLSSIKYGALTTLFLFPNFGALSDTEEGYAFYPDGCGAISYASKEHPSYSAYFLKDVYCSDSMSISDYLGYNDNSKAESVLMPVFGVKNKDSAFVGIVDEGTAYTAIQYSPSGLNIDCQRVNACFRCRRLATVYTKGDDRGLIYETSRFEVPFSVYYYFLNGEEASYSGMANRYREYLLDRGLLTKSTLIGKTTTAVNLIMGVIKKGLFANEFVTATTFSDAERMSEYFFENGTDVMFNIKGYTKQGYSNPVQAGTKISSKIGSEAGLKAFTEAAGKALQQVFLENGYSAVNKTVSPFKTRDFVYDSSGTSLTDKNNRYYLVTPLATLNYLKEVQLDKFKSYGISGIAFDKIGNSLFYDYNKSHKVTREETMAIRQEMLNLSRETLGYSAVEKAGQYAFKGSDWIYDVPSQSTGYVYTDSSVPFYQMVLHGYILYSSKSFNKFYDSDYEQMKAIEYGEIPVFTLTACETSELKNSSCRNEFSTCFEDWKEYIVETAERFREFESVSSEEIVKHESLENEVIKVTYGNGSFLVLNYSEEQIVYDSTSIDSMSYHLFR